MSHVKTNKISPRKGTTTTIGDSGDSVTISSGTTTTNAGTISTAGITGGTINNTTGTITGLQQAINWQTGSIKTSGFTASANEGYFCNTTSAAFTVTLPASPTAGDTIAVKDYANTFDTNNLTLNPNGNKINGSTDNYPVNIEGASGELIYIDSTQGWKFLDASKAADIAENKQYISASGGTETTSGDFKIHTFTGPGTFTVSAVGNSAGSNTVSYVVLAGGASGSGAYAGGGGGAGGFRESKAASDCYSASPLNATCGPGYNLPVSAQGYPITVGGGGASGSCGVPQNGATNGSNSIFSTITSTGGGKGSAEGNGSTGGSGGGGGGVSGPNSGGAGNTPPVSPPQGNNGGTGGGPGLSGGGGGGAGAAAGNFSGSTGGAGGNGVATSITGSPVTRGGGGGGGSHNGGSGGSGGSGGGMAGSPSSPSQNHLSPAPANSGGGGGGSGGKSGVIPGGFGGNGGSGIVIIRYKYQN